MSHNTVTHTNYQPMEQGQVERLLEIGDRLRQLREERELSLDQISAKTLIPTRLLNAIETGQLKQLPEPVYIRGFIKRYAEAMGVNSTELANAFPIDSDMRAVNPSWKESPAAQLRPIHLYAAYIFLIVAAVSGLSYLMSRSTPWVGSTTSPQPTATVSAPTQSASAVPTQPTAGNATSPVAASPAATDQPIRVDITLTAQSWLRVEVDGQTEYEGVLQEGTQRTWTANSELKIRAGNAGGVMVAYNSGEPQPMGQPGAVQTVTFPVSQDAASLPNADTQQTTAQ